MKHTQIYSTKDSDYFAKLIADKLNIQTGKIIRSQFGDGELYHRIEFDNANDLFGQTVIFVGGTETDKNFAELEKIGSTLVSLGANKMIFVIPYFGYSTMERAVLAGEAVTAKINARRLSQIPLASQGNTFLMLDLHVSGILHYFEGDCLRFELYGQKILALAIEELNLVDFVFGTADLGKTKWVEAFADKFKTDIVFVRKERIKEKTKVLDIIGEVKNKTIIIYDDMTRSGGTLVQATEAYLKRGAKEVYAVLSHLALNDEKVIKKLIVSPLKKIITTNSHPLSQHPIVKRSKKFIVKDITPEFTAAIEKITNPK